MLGGSWSLYNQNELVEVAFKKGLIGVEKLLILFCSFMCIYSIRGLPVQSPVTRNVATAGGKQGTYKEIFRYERTTVGDNMVT
jgi:hypothetical protein